MLLLIKITAKKLKKSATKFYISKKLSQYKVSPRRKLNGNKHYEKFTTNEKKRTKRFYSN